LLRQNASRTLADFAAQRLRRGCMSRDRRRSPSNAPLMNAPAILFRASFLISAARRKGFSIQGGSARPRFYPAVYGARAAKIP